MSGNFQNQQYTFTHNTVILNRLMKMNDAQANGDIEKYFIYFRFAFQMIMPFLDIKHRRIIEEDYKLFKQEIMDIEMDIKKADKSKRVEILKLKKEFADEYSGYIVLGLTHTGGIKVTTEGDIQFDEESLERAKTLIRSGTGLPSKMERAGYEKREEGGEIRGNSEGMAKKTEEKS